VGCAIGVASDGGALGELLYNALGRFDGLADRDRLGRRDIDGNAVGDELGRRDTDGDALGTSLGVTLGG